MKKCTKRVWVIMVMMVFFTGVAQADELQELKAYIQSLEARVAQLEKNPNKDGLAAIKAKVAEIEKRRDDTSGSEFKVYWQEGLRLDSADGQTKLKIGGRVMYDWSWSREDDAFGTQEDGHEFRRARLYSAGTIYDNIGYKFQYDFAGGKSLVKDVYIEIKDFPGAALKVGHFKEPIGLNEITSDKYVTFVEPALPMAFVPSRNAGLMLHKENANSTWAAGVFRSTDEDGEHEASGAYAATGRVTYAPVKSSDRRHVVHLGAAASHRSQNNSNTVQYRSRPESHLFGRPVDTGLVEAENVSLYGLEAAWVAGSFSMQGEYIMASTDSPSGSSDVNFSGYYLQSSYFLTGESQNYKKGVFSRVKPKKNYNRKNGTHGAWELAARYSSLDLNSGTVNGGELDDITLGLNWYLNPNTRIMLNCIHADAKENGDADLGVMRFQVDF